MARSIKRKDNTSNTDYFLSQLKVLKRIALFSKHTRNVFVQSTALHPLHVGIGHSTHVRYRQLWTKNCSVLCCGLYGTSQKTFDVLLVRGRFKMSADLQTSLQSIFRKPLKFLLKRIIRVIGVHSLACVCLAPSYTELIIIDAWSLYPIVRSTARQIAVHSRSFLSG